jgi:sulfur carrier protein
MITISINNKTVAVAANSPLANILLELGYRDGKYAVAVNEEFVPRHEYDSIQLNDRDRVDVVTAVQGG